MLRALLVLILLAAGLPLLLVLMLREVPPPVTSFMLQSEVRPVHYEWVPADEIAETARKAVVASEDQKFWQHRGFDLEAMQQAYRENQRRGRRRGASTISQQTAKNLFLWPGGGYLRKGIEAYLTVLIELCWPKARILEVYLNIAEFGPGIYGVEAAAQRYFGKPASRLSAGEAARLAAVLPNPRRWSAARPGPYVMARSAWILRQMGYGPRPAPAGDDPEPIEPEPMGPDSSGEPADGAVPPAPESPPQEGLPEEPTLGDPVPAEDAPDTPERPEEGPTVPPAVPGDSGAGDAPAQPSQPSGGGRVIDEAPAEEAGDWEQSLIL
jgi:monofunctional biosynthetic peptidoglycan transglycosylase